MRRFTRIPCWAWLASVALHAVAALGLYFFLPSTPPDIAAAAQEEVPPTTFNLATERPADRPPADEVPLPQPAEIPEPPDVPMPKEPPPAQPSEPGRLPHLATVPPAVSNDLQALLRDLATRPAAVPTEPEEFPIDPPTDVKPVAEIKPAEHTAPAAPAPAPMEAVVKLGGGKPLHGSLPDGSVAVYLLDRSASMGLNRDTFDAARAALIATVTGTPAGSKFQVLAYHATATPVLRGSGGKLLTAKDDVTREVGTAIAELKAEGNSAHEIGLRAAIACGADYVIWITDATDEELAKAKRALKGAAKPVAVYVGRAVNGAVAEPAELR